MRKRVVSVALFIVLPLAALAANVELPEWESKSDREGFALGGGLWPAAAIPGPGDGFEKADLERLAQAETAAGGNKNGTGLSVSAPPPIMTTPGRAEDLVAVTRPPGEKGAGSSEVASLKPVLGLRVPTPMLMPLRIEDDFAHELPEVAGELRDQYFGLRPVLHSVAVNSSSMGYLVDPQQLLTEQKSHDIQRFLEYHADEAQFDICLLLFGGTQEIPEDVSLEQKHQEWFGEEPVVTVAYFLEHPEKTQIMYGAAEKQRLPAVVFDRIFQSCVREAQVAETAFDQVERFAIELSIRLYWMAKLLERQSSGEAIASTHEELSEPNWQQLAAESEAAVNAAAGGSRVAKVTEKLTELPWVLLGICGVVLVATLGTGWWWWRRDSLTAKPMLFPDLQVPARLGGVYSGGGYVGISFDVSSQNEN